MGATTSVLQIDSASPREDVKSICSSFPGLFNIKGEEEDGSGILVHVEKKITIFVVPSASLPPKTYAVVVDPTYFDACIANASCVSAIKLDEQLSMGEMKLPSGSRVLFALPDVILSKIGREFLMDQLRTQMQRHGRTPLNSVNRNSVQEDGSSHQSPYPSAVSLQNQKLPKFPSLQVNLLEENGKYHSNFSINSRQPVPVKTELFEGQVLVLLRPDNPEKDDPYWNERIFCKKKRRTIVQIQGKFRYEPKGVVYAGGEIDQQMKLGLVTRGLSKVLLRLVDSFNSNVHHSFGDNEGKELPHIVVPAYTFFEQIVVTPPGETPPPITEMFEEPKESSALRKKSQGLHDYKWNTTDTYSFSFYSMYIDLVSWHIVGVPVTGDISLKTFWNDSLLRICMYEKITEDSKHYQKDNVYGFGLQLQYLGKGGDGGKADYDDDDEDDLIHWGDKRTNRATTENIPKAITMKRSESEIFPPADIEMPDEITVDQFYFDAEEDLDDAASQIDRQTITSLDQKTLSCPVTDLLANIDNVSPAWIDVIGSRQGSYSRAYAIMRGDSLTLMANSACQELVEETAAPRLIEKSFSPRLSSSEKMRRMVGYILAMPEASGARPDRISAFLQKPDKLSSDFLRRSTPSLGEKEKSSIMKHGYIARAMSDRHWVEEWFAISRKDVSFHHPSKRKPNFRILLSSIRNVDRLSAELCPNFPNHYFSVIQTAGRSVYLLFLLEKDCNDFVETLRRTVMLYGNEVSKLSVSSLESSSMFPVLEIENPAEEFLQRSTMWNCKNRRILNCGNFVFRQSKNVKPLKLVENALRLALQSGNESVDDPDQGLVFLRSAAALKEANVHTLSEESRLTFFLNLYHVMIMHAYLALGPPDSSLKWISYFNSIAYQVSDDIFSIAELEHCIIRAKMSYPAQFISRFVLPKSVYSIALTKPDFRINFALNCGSLSCPPRIPIYRVETLNEQLDLACSLYLESVTLAQSNAREIVLNIPRICQWFSGDFGTCQEDLLCKIEPYLTGHVRKVFGGLKTPPSNRFIMDWITIRFHPYSFECRALRQL